MGQKRYALRVLMRNPLGRPTHRWKDTIKMDIRVIRWGVWTGFIWHMTDNTVMNLQVP
jgi:hypothetical protein